MHGYIYCLNPYLCCREEIVKSKFNSMIGLVDRERVDEELYDDYETAKAREVSAPSNVHPLLFLTPVMNYVEGTYDFSYLLESDM